MNVLARRRRRGAAVLVYHRVRDAASDPLGMSVSPAHFAEHLQVLRASARPILPLAELADRHVAGTLPAGAVAVTIDDGYVETIAAARILADHDVPATLFVPTASIGAGRMWWDALLTTLLSDREVQPFDVTVAGQVYAIDPGPAIDPSAHLDWVLTSRPHPTPRHFAFHRLRTLLLCASADERDTALKELDAAATGADVGADERLMLDAEELSLLDSTTPVGIGSHTASHLSLVRADHRTRAVEVDRARDVLAEIVGRQVDEVAYPHGHVDGDVAAAARRSGHTVGVARGNLPVRGDAQVMRLPRVEVGDCTGADLERRLATLG